MNQNPQIDRIRLRNSILIGLVLMLIIWGVRLIEWSLSVNFYYLGIYPLKVQGLIGILTAPLVHANFAHAAANSVPLFVTTVVIFYFYREVAWQVFLLIWVITGIWVWSFARPSWHIGASGILYGYVSFLFFSGVLRRNVRLMAISLLMVFLYGSFIWGIFPDFFPQGDVSWESHLMGAIAGLVIAFFFRKSGMQKEVYKWEEEEEDDEEDDGEWKVKED